jgi:hypothetical protein
MHNARTTAASLKLFPRLAMRKKSPTTIRFDRPTSGARRKAPNAVDERETDRAQVRARLLRMILNNERARRDGQRPNAS